METKKAEKYIRGNEKMNSSLCTDWPREMIIESHNVYAKSVTTSQQQTIERLRELLKTAIEFTEKQRKQVNDKVDFFNNNTPGVGIDVDYQTRVPKFKWVEEAEQLLNTTEPIDQ